MGSLDDVREGLIILHLETDYQRVPRVLAMNDT